jgi:hypothetical protein
VDAATNSGKAEIKKITEEIEFSTFSGRRRLYLFDESHQLSKDALDALLKPLEDNLPGSEDKRLVCIFCTTEPEKMRTTVLSRCAPAFVIHPLAPETIGNRLSYICDKEGIEYEEAMLPVIAEITECHIRDAIKAVEGVALLGGVTREHVTSYLHLDLNEVYLDVLLGLGEELGASIKGAEEILGRTSPQTCYRRLAQTAMMAYKVHLGVEKPAGYWDGAKIRRLAARGTSLLGYASVFSTRPGRPTPSMLYCDIGQLHHTGSATPSLVVQRVVTVASSEASAPPTTISSPSPPQVSAPVGTLTDTEPSHEDASVVVDKRAVRKSAAQKPAMTRTLDLDVDRFVWLVGLRVAELDEAGSVGSAGRSYMGGR